MKWYDIKKCHDEYCVYVNVEKHGVASKRIFAGTKTECEKYCKENNIKLGIEEAKKW